MLVGLWPLHLPARPATIDVREIQPGMKGYGLTVFRGTEPERFDVEVIDVLHNFRPDQDLILIRTPHPRLDKTQSVAGMSGSPVYLDGRLAGAYAYGWGYGSEPIAGVTPIVNMLRELKRPLRALPAPVGRPLPAREPGSEERGGGAASGALDAFAPLRSYATHRGPRQDLGPRRAATPLLVGGLTDSVAGLLAEHLAPLGLEVKQAGPGGSARRERPPLDFEDGGALAVQLIRGDVQATAVGTVTHVAGQRLLAFGHPMLDGGQVSLPTATARVLHVLASRRTSFKIAEALEPRGALVQDRQATVVVDRDAQAHPVPVRVRIHGVPGLPRDEWSAEVAQHPLLTSPLVLSAAASALGAALSDQAPAAFEMRSSVWLEGRGPIRSVDAGYSERGVATPGTLVSARPFALLNAAMHNPFERLTVERVEMDFHVDFGRSATEIVAARVPSGVLDPGSRVPLTLTLRKLDEVAEQRVVQLDIPHRFAGEKLKISIEPGSAAEPIQPRPRNVDELLSNLTGGFPDRSIVISLRREARGARLDGHVLHDLPASALYALSGQNDSGRADHFPTEHHVVVPMEAVLWGSTSLEVEVRKEPR